MKRWAVLLLVIAAPALTAERLAKNVILFLGDAAGIPTVSGASIYAYQAPGKLFLQNMPHMGLMDTSSASNWVADSAAGMTAIVTGRKTHNGVISQSDDAVRGKKDGQPLKTILEYAEERGLSTGVVSDSAIASATPAACYAHVNDRRKVGEIFLQALRPSYGDGVDVVIGPGRREIFEDAQKLGVDVAAEMKAKGRPLYESLGAIPQGVQRAVVLLDENFDLALAAERAIDMLSRNPKGYFLMVESDCHTDDIVRGLERMVALDRIIRRTAERVPKQDTLVIFAADHSYDFRISTGSPKDRPLFSDADKSRVQYKDESVRLGSIRRDDHHTAEEVLVTAQGPGAERVRGVFANTDLFRIMMAAYGWESRPAPRPKGE